MVIGFRNFECPAHFELGLAQDRDQWVLVNPLTKHNKCLLTDLATVSFMITTLRHEIHDLGFPRDSSCSFLMYILSKYSE
jgi:hypothetical protein